MIPMDRLVASSVARQRFFAVLLVAFSWRRRPSGGDGVYGVLACAVVQRTKEIGIRGGSGARRAGADARAQDRRAAARAGIALGLVAAAAGTRLLQECSSAITPLDPHTFVAVSLAFGIGGVRVLPAGPSRDERRSDDGLES